MTELEKYRDQIDAIDRDIVRLFHERMQVVEKVADYKIKSGKSVFDSQREQQKIRTLGKLCENDFEKRAVVEIFEQIMAISRKKQYQLLTENGVTLPVDYASTEKLHFQNARVVFQGVEGAYSFEAMKTFFDDSIETSHVSTWREAMDLVARHEMISAFFRSRTQPQAVCRTSMISFCTTITILWASRLSRLTTC